MNGLYLTFIQVPRNWCNDTHQQHQVLATKLFGQRYLWARPERTSLVVQADRPIDPKNDFGYDFPNSSVPVKTDYDSGESINLALIANTAKRSKTLTRRIDNAEATNWLSTKLADAVSFDHIEATPVGTRVGRDGKHVITHYQTVFHATGRVSSPAHLANLIRTGVGRGKAYGNGLLVVTQ